MAWLRQAVNSSIGLKFIMAGTGLALFLFLIAHLLGNLLVFKSPEALNEYAKGLRDLGPLLWVARLGLLAVFLVHIRSAIVLTRRNKAARPTPYVKKQAIQSTHASRTMVITGLLVLAYVLFHLAHYTLHWINPDYASYEGDVYRMVIDGFSNTSISMVYVVLMVVLGFHLSHGITSFFQTLGLNNPKYTPCIRIAAPALGWGMAVVYALIPISVMIGVIS